jgi:hypothetical protein
MNARHLVPALMLTCGSGVLFSRAGFGPFGDPRQRQKPCTAGRCRHNAFALAFAAAATFAAGERRHGRKGR